MSWLVTWGWWLTRDWLRGFRLTAGEMECLLSRKRRVFVRLFCWKAERAILLKRRVREALCSRERVEKSRVRGGARGFYPWSRR